jgi:hypothetical protein
MGGMLDISFLFVTNANSHSAPLLQTCNVMSGHRKGENTYFVPRTQLPLAHSTDWYCTLLLPHLLEWQSQARSREGDKSTCCNKFLHQLLPYFVEVLVQDGIYFIRDFPNHPMSQLLKVSFLLWPIFSN